MKDTAKGPMPATVREFRMALLHFFVLGLTFGVLIMTIGFKALAEQ